MIHNKTFNNAIDTLKQLGIEHEQISTTTTGDIWKIDMDQTLFPLFHINPVSKKLLQVVYKCVLIL